jgi:subtilisin family serine protease
MVDTAVDPTEPALAGASLELVSIKRADEKPSTSEHGTAIAAILVGATKSATPGLLPSARLIAVDAFYSEGGVVRTDAMHLVEAIQLLLSRGVRILNLSFSGPPNEILKSVIDEAVSRNVFIAAAAGNTGPDGPPAYPAAFEGVTAVTAVDRQLNPYVRATRGPYIALAAPGVDLWTAGPKGGKRNSGTSYATPFVAAAAAIIRATDPEAAAADTEHRLESSALDLGEPGRDSTYGWGLLQFRPDCVPLVSDDGVAVTDVVSPEDER